MNENQELKSELKRLEFANNDYKSTKSKKAMQDVEEHETPSNVKQVVKLNVFK